METVRIEHISSAGGTEMGMANGDAMGGDSMDDPSVSTAMNGQLEIEIPSGDTRHGAIHTIQLQSPGGNTHIVEGLVVTSGGGGEMMEGETTLIQGPGGTFLIPTSNHHNNNLATAMVTSPSNTCEVITADNADHHILSGLQVVRVTTGENGETIFLVPSSGHDKDGMQQVMVLQSADELTEESHAVPAEMVEESVELNIPSPKPVLTTVKQEAGLMTTNGDETLHQYQHHHHHHGNTTLVVVTGGSNGSAVVAESAPRTPPPQQVEQKPVLTSVNGHASSTSTTTTATANVRGPARLPNGALLPPPATVSADDRPKRKAAIKAVQTRKEALASVHSPRKSNPNRSPKKTKVEVISQVQPPKPTPIPTTQTTSLGNKANNRSPQILSIVSTSTLASAGGGTLTLANPAHQPPPPPVVLPPPPPPVHKVILTGGTPVQSTSRSFFLLPEDVVSDSEDDGEGPPIRKCVVCLRRRRFTADIFDTNSETSGGPGKQPLLQHMDVLIAHLNIPVSIFLVESEK